MTASVSKARILVIDLLDVADIGVIQHIAALRQNLGEASDDRQHKGTPFDKSLLI